MQHQTADQAADQVADQAGDETVTVAKIPFSLLPRLFSGPNPTASARHLPIITFACSLQPFLFPPTDLSSPPLSSQRLQEDLPVDL